MLYVCMIKLSFRRKSNRRDSPCRTLRGSWLLCVGINSVGKYLPAALSLKQPISKYYPQTRQSRIRWIHCLRRCTLACGTVLPPRDTARGILSFYRISSSTISRLISSSQFSTCKSVCYRFVVSKINQRRSSGMHRHRIGSALCNLWLFFFAFTNVDYFFLQLWYIWLFRSLWSTFERRRRFHRETAPLRCVT